MNLRLFISIGIPKAVQAQFQEQVYPILTAFKQELKIVPPKNLHFTLRFLGYRPPQTIRKLVERLENLCQHSAFKIQLKGIGSFHNRVFWIGIQKGQKELQALTKTIQEELELEPEAFSPHLTLARNKSLKGWQAKELLKKLKQVSFDAHFEAKTVFLMRSTLKPTGPAYTLIKEWKLKDAQD